MGKVVVMLLIAALTVASMAVSSHGRPVNQQILQEEEEEQKSVLELSGRDEMVRMAGYGEEKLSTVLISGLLLCLRGQHPISGALVAATCRTNNTDKRQITGAQAVTDKSGEFIIDLPSQLHAIVDLDKACSLKVLRIPRNSPCRHSDFAGKHQGISLSSAENGIRTYAAGAMTFQNQEM